MREYIEELKTEMPEAMFIAADKGVNTEDLKDEIFERLKLIRLYLKPQGKKADLEEPMIIRKGSTVGEVAENFTEILLEISDMQRYGELQ